MTSAVVHFTAVLCQQLAAVVLPAMADMVMLAMLFTVCELASRRSDPTARWWRKPDLVTDVCFALVPKLLNAYGQLILTVIGFALVYGIRGKTDLSTFLAHGYGPASGLAAWEQVIVYLIGNDLMMYVTHRTFHTARLWPFHAVHHSSTQLEWISATRFHPIDQIFHSGLSDVVMLLVGISPDVLVWLAPWNVISSALVHANLDWTFGPLRYVFASPVFHRWHHTAPDRGGEMNFAGTFSCIDLLFGTFYMPRRQRPDAFGVDDPAIPKNFLGLLIYPFKRIRLQSQSR